MAKLRLSPIKRSSSPVSGPKNTIPEWQNIPQDWRSHLGFIYLIRCKLDGRWYVGKKGFYASAGKEGRHRVKKISNWRSYWGSSKDLLAHIEKHGYENFERTILSVHDTKFDLMYEELLAQIKYDVVHDPLTFNSVINLRSYLPQSKKRSYPNPSGSLVNPP